MWTQALNFVLVVCALVALPATAASEDWDFTPDDYATLRLQGADLQMGEDSTWLPKPYAENLLRTLRYALDSERNPRVTEGINVHDFYHGHVLCKNPVPGETLTLISEYYRASKEIHPLPTNIDKIDEGNFAEFVEAERKYEKLTGRFLEAALREGSCPEIGILYHTFEYRGPDGLRPGDPLRNILTPLLGTPLHYQVPDMNNASTYTRDYLHYSQIAFLVDSLGVVHTVVGTTSALSRVVGKVLD